MGVRIRLYEAISAEKVSSSMRLAANGAFRILKEHKYTSLVQASKRYHRGKP